MNRRKMFPAFSAILDAVCWIGRRLWPLLPSLAFLLFLIYLVANVRAGRALQQELALIRAQGAPLSLREAAPPPVPDDQNAALVYEQAFQRLPRLEKEPAADAPGQQRIARADEDAIDRFVSDDPRRQRQVTIPQVRQALSGTEAALALVRKAASMPRCRFPVNWEAGAGALFPHLPKLRSLSRLLGAHALVAASEGNSSESAADIAAIVGIARHLLSEPIMISQLIAYSSLATARHALARVLEIAPLTGAESRSLEQALSEVELHSSFQRAVETERCLGVWAFDAARDDPAKLLPFMGSDKRHRFLLLHGTGPLGEPLRRLDEVAYLQFMAREVARARAHEPAPPAGRVQNLRFPIYAQVTRLVAPVFTTATRKRDEATAGLARARCSFSPGPGGRTPVGTGETRLRGSGVPSQWGGTGRSNGLPDLRFYCKETLPSLSAAPKALGAY